MEQQHDTGTIELATVKDREELLDLLYRVFTHNNPTHPRFEKMYPDLFVPTEEALGCHAIMRVDGRIKACVGVYPMTVRTAGYEMTVAEVGQVGTDLDARGKGYMGRLMRFQLQRLKDAGIHIASLGGRHDRYGHFGFETAGSSFLYYLDAHSLHDVPVTRTIARHSDNPGEAVTDSMFELYRKTSPAYVVESADRFRARLSRAECEVWTATPAGATEPDAWAVVSRTWKKIDAYCGSTDGLLEIALAACKALDRLGIDIPSASRELGNAFRAHCTWLGLGMLEMIILNRESLEKNFRDQGWKGPVLGNGPFKRGEEERYCFGPERAPGGGGLPYPFTLPYIYHA